MGMKKLFIIGGMGSGKSTLRKVLAEQGVPFIDLDKVGHDVLEWDTVKDDLVEAFGADISGPDRRVVRRRLRRRRSPRRRKRASSTAFPCRASRSRSPVSLTSWSAKATRPWWWNTPCSRTAKRPWPTAPTWLLRCLRRLTRASSALEVRVGTRRTCATALRAVYQRCRAHRAGRCGVQQRRHARAAARESYRVVDGISLKRWTSVSLEKRERLLRRPLVIKRTLVLFWRHARLQDLNRMQGRVRMSSASQEHRRR